VVEGTAINLGRDERLNERAHLRQSVSAADLGAAVRQTGIGRRDDGAAVTLGPSGNITV
jgi:hypothetical protein